MKIVKQKITGQKDQLQIWQELFGGEIAEGKLTSKSGTINSYAFDLFELYIFQVQFEEETTVERIHTPTPYYPVLFSDEIIFEPNGERKTIGRINKSDVTGVFFSNTSDSITYPAGKPFSLIVLRIKESSFSHFFKNEDNFVQQINNRNPFFLYQMLTAEMKLSYFQILNNKGEDAIDKNIIYSHGLLLLSLFFRETKPRLSAHNQQLTNTKRQAIVAVKNKILEDLSSPVRMKDLVVHTGMSETYIRLYFKEVFGMSINSFYQYYRIELAKEMLSSSELSVSEVAYKLGYTHLGHFIRMFKKQYGMTPKKFQLLLKSD